MSEMTGSSITIKVPVDWEGEPIIRRHISDWTEGRGGYSMPIYGGEEYLERTVRLPEFEWFEAMNVAQWEGDEFLTLDWAGELNYGWTGDSDADNFLDWLVEHRIPFHAQTDAKYENDGYELFYDGSENGEVVERAATNGGPVIGWQEFKALADKHPASAWQLIDEVSALLRPFDLGACDISHLPADPPKEEDEDAD
ncbi:MAG: hypothetical protein K0Q89_42 [Thermomicrobiales bacterium]|jgi:hypothetical protein|nr:hypothetical protein [Thermomicrobiales bacterium]